VAEEDVGRLGIEPSAAKAYPSLALRPGLPGYFSVNVESFALRVIEPGAFLRHIGALP
jgi:hypothetical protein